MGGGGHNNRERKSIKLNIFTYYYCSNGYSHKEIKSSNKIVIKKWAISVSCYMSFLVNEAKVAFY